MVRTGKIKRVFSDNNRCTLSVDDGMGALIPCVGDPAHLDQGAFVEYEMDGSTARVTGKKK